MNLFNDADINVFLDLITSVNCEFIEIWINSFINTINMKINMLWKKVNDHRE